MIIGGGVPLTWGFVLFLVVAAVMVALVREYDGPSSKSIRDGERKLMDEMMNRKPGTETEAKKE